MNSSFTNPHMMLVGMSLDPREFVSEAADDGTF
jgi:hypothetical protein